MKCEHCGGNLSLNDKYCPHCGSINEQARRHVEDMEHYEGEFEETKEEVYAHTRRFTQLSVRIVIIMILLAVIMLLVLLMQNVWDLQYKYERAKAEARYNTYSKEMEQMLADGNYIGFYYYIGEHHISSYQSKYQKYAKLYSAAGNYTEVYRDIMDIHHPNYYDQGEEEDMVEDLMRDLEYYFTRIEDPYQYYEIDEELTAQVTTVMTQNIEALLTAYCGLDADEASSLPQLTKAKRALLIEESALPIVTENMARAVEEHEQNGY